jgi:hypothetical protein
MTYAIGTCAMSLYLKGQNKLIDEKKMEPVDGVAEFRYAP